MRTSKRSAIECVHGHIARRMEHVTLPENTSAQVPVRRGRRVNLGTRLTSGRTLRQALQTNSDAIARGSTGSKS